MSLMLLSLCIARRNGVWPDVVRDAIVPLYSWEEEA